MSYEKIPYKENQHWTLISYEKIPNKESQHWTLMSYEEIPNKEHQHWTLMSYEKIPNKENQHWTLMSYEEIPNKEHLHWTLKSYDKQIGLVLYKYQNINIKVLLQIRGYSSGPFTLTWLRACHILPMYLAGTKPEQKINNGEKIGVAPSR